MERDSLRPCASKTPFSTRYATACRFHRLSASASRGIVRRPTPRAATIGPAARSPVRDERAEEREKQRTSLIDVMELATKFFQDQLQSAAGAKARAYLRDRGLGFVTFMPVLIRA
jgi:hypothetical protein